MTKLEEIRNSLNNYIEEELKKSPPDRDWEVFSFEDDLIFAAKTRAERRFEELPEPENYDD